MNRPIVISDLDGTLADCKHRLHHIRTPGQPKDWEAFYDACGDDLPMEATIAALRALADAGHMIWIFTGRSESVMGMTLDWLVRHDVPVDRIVMRSAGNREPDDQMKERWLKESWEMMATPEFIDSFGSTRIVMAFEDRDRCVAMWRYNNVPCFQVAPGAF